LFNRVKTSGKVEIIGIQESNIFARAFLNRQVARGAATMIFTIRVAEKMYSVIISRDLLANFPTIISRTILHQNNFRRLRLN